MRWMAGIFAVAVALWCGYWFAGSTAIDRALRREMARIEAAGQTARAQDLRVQGFPNRFDLVIEGLDLADPARGLGWQVPELQVFAMTWKPWHIIAALPAAQTLTLPGQQILLTGQGQMASLRASPSTDLPLAEVRLVGQTLRAVSDAGWSVGLGTLAAALRADPAAAAAYQFGLEATAIAPDPALIAALAAPAPGMPAADLPAVADLLRLNLGLDLTAPLDRHAGQTRPALAALRINEAQLVWGALKATASGGVEPDAQGFAAGRVEIRLQGWDRLPPLLVAAGVLRADLAPTVLNVLNAAAAGKDVLVLPLVLKDGQMGLGPLPLGPAPRFATPAG